MNMQSAIAVKSNGTLINNVQRRSLPRKQKLKPRLVLLKRRQKLKLLPALLKRRQKLKLLPALLKRKRKLKELPALLKKKRKLKKLPALLKKKRKLKKLPAEKQKRVPVKKQLPDLLLIKGFQKRKLSVSLKKEPEHAKPLHRKLPLFPLMLLMIPKNRNMGIFQLKRSVISVKKQFARDTKICLQLTLTVKHPRRKRKKKPKLRKQKKM